MMKQFSGFGAVLVVFLLVGWAYGQRQEVTIKTTQVGGNVYMLEGSGGNIGVSAGPDGVLMIDDQFAQLADKIKAAIVELGHGEPRFLVNTHWHADHTGGNPVFGRTATIVAHDNVRQRLATKQRMRGRTTGPAPPEALPVITFADSLSFHFNGEEVKVIHLPEGHTDGDCVIYFTGSNVVHMGDHLFSGLLPFVDLESGGDVSGFTKNLARVIEMIPDDAKVIPGHGPLSTVEDLKKSHRMLTETTAMVRQKMDAGRTLEEIQKEGLADRWKGWAWNFIGEERWIEIVFRSLRARR